MANSVSSPILSALSWGVYAAMHKRVGEKHASGTTMMWIFLMSAAMLAPTMAMETARHPDDLLPRMVLPPISMR